MAIAPDEALRLIREYQDCGDHRTGTPGDDAATAWIVDALRGCDIHAGAQPFTFPRVDVRTGDVATAAGTVSGVPLYDGGATGPGGVSGPLVEAESVPGGIALWRAGSETPLHGPGIYGPLGEAAAAGTLGVAIIAGDDLGGPVVRNAERIDDPFELPVIQIAPRDAGPLTPGSQARLTLDFARAPGRATNVVGMCPGADPAAAPVVLMTPKSGWYTCAAERGGGIAVWLGVAREAAVDAAPRALWLVASSGHELHHYGLDAYLDDLPIAVAEARCWVHLGASIGARGAATRAR